MGHRAKPYQRGTGTFVEQWIVRIDKWEGGTKQPGYYIVRYGKVSVRALDDKEINQFAWRFSLRDPVFHEAEPCAGHTPVLSKDHQSSTWRPARLKDYTRTKLGVSESIPQLNELKCLIADKPPVAIEANH